MRFSFSSNVVLPDGTRKLGQNCIGLSPGEIASLSYEEFARFVRFETGAAGLFAADWTASGVQFWLPRSVLEENVFDMKDAFRWMKAVDYLMSWQRDLSGIACVTLSDSSPGFTLWRIWDGAWRILFQNERRDGEKAFKETGAWLLDAVRPEAVRKLEADLAGKKFVPDLELRRMLAI